MHQTLDKFYLKNLLIQCTATGGNLHANYKLTTKPSYLLLEKDNFWEWIGILDNQVKKFQWENILTITIDRTDYSLVNKFNKIPLSDVQANHATRTTTGNSETLATNKLKGKGMYTWILGYFDPILQKLLRQKKNIVQGDGPLSWKILSAKVGKAKEEDLE